MYNFNNCKTKLYFFSKKKMRTRKPSILSLCFSIFYARLDLCFSTCFFNAVTAKSAASSKLLHCFLANNSCPGTKILTSAILFSFSSFLSNLKNTSLEIILSFINSSLETFSRIKSINF